ncbi:MAG: sensor histidine kinase [Bacteroidota bacterium]
MSDTSEASITTADSESSSSNTVHRYAQERIRTAQSVQLRDAGPLIKLESLLSDLVMGVEAKGGYIALSAEEDVPIAVTGDVRLPLPIEEDDEGHLFCGEPILVEDHLCYPFEKGEHVVGYVALHLDEIQLNETLKHLIHVYATLASKELELADKTAKMQYQNEQISRKQRQLEQAITFKNNILSLTTHDIRSPLNAVKGYLELLDEHIEEEETDLDQVKEYQGKISTGVQNIADLVDQLNEIALLELQQMELNLIKVDLNWVTQEVCDVLQGPALSKQQELIYHRYDEPLYVEVDIPKAKRILFNLIGNAIKYTEQEGRIEVDLRQSKGMAHVHIQDNGIGIAADKLNAIFEPFHKASEQGTSGELSTGLGLFTSNYFARLFKGSISVESEKGVGSTFSVHLPVAQLGF